MNRFLTGMIGAAVLSVALMGLGQINEGNLITGNFYKMNDSSLQDKYNSINWNTTASKTGYAGSVHLNSFKNLSHKKTSINDNTVKTSLKEAIILKNSKNTSVNINLSQKILGLDNNIFSLNKSSEIKLRFRDNVSIKMKSANNSYEKEIIVYEPRENSSIDGKSEGKDTDEEEEGLLKLNLSNTDDRNITDRNILELVNDQNRSAQVYFNNFTVENKINMSLNTSETLKIDLKDLRTLKIEQESKNSYRLDYTRYSNQSKKLENENVTEEPETNNTSTNISETNKSSNQTSNLTGNQTQEAGYPENGGKWVEIETDRIEDFYVFKYEASRKDANSTSEGESSIPYSQKGVRAWNEISQIEASKACSRLGENYSLPSSKQWQVAALSGRSDKISNNNIEGNTGSPKNSCETYSDGRTRGLCKTGTGPSRWANSAGAVDMVGNMWEWTSTVYNVSDIELAGKSGYIKGWSKSSSLPKNLTEKNRDVFGDSYFYASSEGTRAVRKGGGVGMNSRSGVFSTLIDRNPNYESSSIGFRCVYAE